LTVAIIGVSPFTDSDAVDLVETATGDLLKPGILAGFGAILIYLASSRRSSVSSSLQCRLVNATLIWMLLSASWSTVPDVSFRRALLGAITVSAMFAATKRIGPIGVLRVFALLLATLIVGSLASGFLVLGAIHSASTTDPAIAGCWRGLFDHKNSAGAACAICILMSMYFLRSEKNAIWAIAIFASICLLILSRSKTSIALLVASATIGSISSYLLRARSGKIILAATFSFLSSVPLILLFIFSEQWLDVFSDPAAFTGRVSIWQSVAELIDHRPVLGYGFGSIYRVGAASPLIDYAGGWILLLNSGHNGYLDVSASIGLFGLALVVISFIALPLNDAMRKGLLPPRIQWLIICVIAFASSHNILESSLLNADRVTWLALVVAGAAIHAMHNFPNRAKIIS
jgi:O-antigen ligase